MISEESISEVKQRMDIVGIVSTFIVLKKEGTDMVACCPFHNEKSPSFKVSGAKQMYKCFGCGRSGDAIAFVQEHEKVGYPEAVRRIAGLLQIEIREEGAAPVYTTPRLAEGIIHESVIEFFKARGISESTLADFKVSQSVEWMPKAKAEVSTINFNYFREGILTNVKYRARDKDFKLAKGAELIFYNMDGAKGNDYVIIVEGEMDALAIHEAGIKHVVSVPNGAAKSGSNSNLKYLDNCIDYFKELKSIVLCTDNDEPGRQLREELARRLGKSRCMMVDFPDGCKDANDVLLKHGKSGIGKLLASAHEFPIEGIMNHDDMMDVVQDYYMNGYPRGIRVGVSGFDDLLAFMPGQLTTVTGLPGSGKSEFVDELMAKAALNHGIKSGICSFENQPAPLHVSKMMEKVTRKAFAHRVDASSRMSLDEFGRAAAMVRNHFFFFNVNQVEATLDAILDKAKELVERYGIHWLLIDPWNYIELTIPQGMTETQYISLCLTKIRAFAVTTGTHVFLIAHPVKMPKTNGKYEVPTLYNISGSAHFFNKTDNGFTVYRDFETNVVDVHVQKVRYSWLGKIGCASFTYSTELRQYTPIHDL